MHTIICKNCDKSFEAKYKKRKFCCLECSNNYNKKNKKVGGDHTSLKYFQKKYGEKEGSERYKKYKKRLSKSLTGKAGYWKDKKFSKETKEKISKSLKKSEYSGKIRGKKFEEIYGYGSLKKHKERMKGVFSLEWFKSKYGEENGAEKYKERSERIKDTSYFKIYNKKNKNNYSKISQKLFWEIYNKIENPETKKIYFAELNHEYGCETNKNFDFVISKYKKIIEFNGDIFHANPEKYKKDDCPNPYFKKLTSEKIWEFDRKKINQAIKNGYKVLVIWESEYIEDKEKTINKCLEFIENEF